MAAMAWKCASTAALKVVPGGDNFKYVIVASNCAQRAAPHVCQMGSFSFVCYCDLKCGRAGGKADPEYEVSKMAYNDKHLYAYTDDDGTVMAVRLSEQKAALDGFQAAAAGTPLWPRKAAWIRHVGVRFADGKRGQYPCKDTQGKYKQIGGTGSVVVSGTNKNYTIVGRTGERGGS